MRVKEESLSENGRFLLRAMRAQSAVNQSELIADREGYISVDLFECNISITCVSLLKPGKRHQWNCMGATRASLKNNPARAIDYRGRLLRGHLRETGCVVFGFEWTVDEWIAEFGADLGINNRVYVRQMCRQQIVNSTPTRKGWQARLPAPFKSFKSGRVWVITL